MSDYLKCVVKAPLPWTMLSGGMDAICEGIASMRMATVLPVGRIACSFGNTTFFHPHCTWADHASAAKEHIELLLSLGANRSEATKVREGQRFPIGPSSLF